MTIDFNPLGLPTAEFTLDGVRAGRLVSDALSFVGYRCRYDSDTKKIVILDSSKLSRLEFGKIVHPIMKHVTFLPLIESRTADGNFQFVLRRKITDVFDLTTSPLYNAILEENESKIMGLLFDRAPQPQEFLLLCTAFPAIAQKVLAVYPEVVEKIEYEVLLEVRKLHNDLFTSLKPLCFLHYIKIGDKVALQALLETKAACSAEECARLWNTFPDLAKHYTKIHHMCTTCPWSVLEALCKESDEAFIPIVSKAAIPDDEYFRLCTINPELMQKAVIHTPAIVKGKDSNLVTQLLQLPDCESLILAVLAAKVHLENKHFYMAVEAGYYKAAEQIFKSKNSLTPHIGEHGGNTPLHVAIEKGVLPLIEPILQADSIFKYTPNEANLTPLELAEKCANVEIMRLIRSRMLYEKSKEGDRESVKALLEQDSLTTKSFVQLCCTMPDLVCLQDARFLPLIKTFPQDQMRRLIKHEEFFIQLLSLGLNVTNHKTLLLDAINQRSNKLACALIDAKVDTSAHCAEHGDTPLHVAVKQRNADLLVKLLAARADVHAKNHEGFQPIHLAALTAQEELIQHLVAAGASLCAVDKNQDTAAKIILSSGLKGCLPLVVAKMPEVFKECVEILVHGGESRMVHAFLKNMILQDQKFTQDRFLLELALLFNDRGFATLYTGPDYLIEIEALITRNPPLFPTIVDLFFDVEELHYKVGDIALNTVSVPTIAPKDLGEFTERLSKVLSQYNETFEIVVQKVPRSSREFQKLVRRFIKNAVKEGDSQLKNYLSHLLVYLQQCEKEETTEFYNRTIIEISRELAESCYDCTVQYQDTAITLYKKYCAEFDSTGSNAFLEQLQLLRAIVVESMADEPYAKKQQSVHTIGYIKRKLGYLLQLPDRALFVTQQKYDNAGFIDAIPSDSVLLQSFKDRYKPSVIVEHLKASLVDERERTRYIDWAKVHLKKQNPSYEEHKRKMQALQAKEHAIITNLLLQEGEPDADMVAEWKKELDDLAEKEGIEPVLGFTYLQAANSEAEGALCSWLQDDALAVKNFPLILALMKQNILKLAR